MTRRLVPLAGLAIVAMIVATPFAYRSWASVRYRNLRVVEPETLYRSGQMTQVGFERFVKEHGIKTVISLRDTKDEGKEPPDKAEADFCKAHGIMYYRLSPAKWSVDEDGTVPATKNVQEFIRIVRENPTAKPILIHCFAGIHRTGAHVAVYRMECNGWSREQAIEEMKSMGTSRTTFDDDLIDFIESYTPNRQAKPVGDTAPRR